MYASDEVVDISKAGSDNLASDLGFTGAGISENIQEYVLGATSPILGQTTSVYTQ